MRRWLAMKVITAAIGAALLGGSLLRTGVAAVGQYARGEGRPQLKKAI